MTLFYFFSIAHTIHEIVTEQASIMVNGKLKEYQIKVCNNCLFSFNTFWPKAFFLN